MNKGLKILLIEDDPDDAELTIHSLKKNNLVNNVQHIDDGEIALEFLFSQEAPTPDLILLDLRMPRVDGITILKRLKSDSDKQRIPVVAMVSSKDGQKYVESFDIKADAYIHKPVEFKNFALVVADLGLSWQILGSAIID